MHHLEKNEEAFTVSRKHKGGKPSAADKEVSIGKKRKVKRLLAAFTAALNNIGDNEEDDGEDDEGEEGEEVNLDEGLMIVISPEGHVSTAPAGFSDSETEEEEEEEVEEEKGED
jgi:hypothetical protein